nr:hypothetical protein Iba_chr10fCG7980 [Ipomoea batatas]
MNHLALMLLPRCRRRKKPEDRLKHQSMTVVDPRPKAQLQNLVVDPRMMLLLSQNPKTAA